MIYPPAMTGRILIAQPEHWEVETDINSVLPLPLGLGGIMIPTATLATANAAGTVQFKDGSANLGAPVTVVAGIGRTPLSFLRPGQHSLTAVFTPTDPPGSSPRPRTP